jgi:hypothetical protein
MTYDMGLYDFDNIKYYGDGNPDENDWLGEGGKCKLFRVTKTGKCASTRKCKNGPRSKKYGKCPCKSKRRYKKSGKCVPVNKPKKL